MKNLLGNMVIEDANTTHERRYQVLEIYSDSDPRKMRHGMDVYSNMNELIKRVGYRTGMLENHRGVMNGDYFYRISPSDKELMERIMEKALGGN